MTEKQPPDGHMNGGGGGDAQQPVASSETVGSKRQRRPSVRLGEIGGDQYYDAGPRRTTTTSKQWKQQLHHHGSLKEGAAAGNPSSKGSKTRALTNLNTIGENLDEDKEVNLDTVAIGSWKVRDPKKRAFSKRVRTNWASTKLDDNGSCGGGVGGGGDNSMEGDANDDLEGDYRDFIVENSESPLKEQSPVHSLENLGDGNERGERQMYYNRRGIGRARDSINSHYDHQDGIDFSGPSDADGRDDRNNREKDGVRIWLNGLGLGRYAPVFEIHEVDDEILPMLTLEDLKDMGISAVGSRRKMFCAIQKLNKGFS